MRTFQDNVTIINDHSPFPDPADNEKQKLRKALKTRAIVADEPPSQTIFSVQRDINRENAAVIPSYSANQTTINRVKQEKQSRMQEPQSLTDFELQELLKMTRSGERFLHFYSGPNDTKLKMVFITLLLVLMIGSALAPFIRPLVCSFRNTPSTHQSRNALLPDKKEEMYIRLLNCFGMDFPKRSIIDFRIVVKNYQYPKMYNSKTRSK